MHPCGNVRSVWYVKEAQTSNHFQVTMGSEISSNRDHADAMGIYRDWTTKQAAALLQKYKKNDCGRYTP